jgi:hypothetical protein
MSKTRSRGKAPLSRALAFALAAALLAGCASALSGLPNAVGGLPQGTPERPALAPDYPAVHDMPPTRAEKVLTKPERDKAAADLAATRDEQAKRAAAKDQ